MMRGTPEPRGWGTQSGARWAVGDQSPRPVSTQGPCNPWSQKTNYGDRPIGLWRLAVHATPVQQVTLELSWGAGKDVSELAGVLVPMVAFVPGQVQIVARPTVPPTEAFAVLCQVTPVSGYGRQRVCTVLIAAPGGSPLPPSAVAVQALDASTITLFGATAPLALAAGVRLDNVAGPAVLDTGRVIVEHEL